MANQRFRLGEVLNGAPKYYHATFGELTHKTNSAGKKIPVVLLKDIYLVNENDQKIRLAKSNDFIDQKGRHIVADHAWVKLTKPFFKDNLEILPGDEIIFKAAIKPYKIVRNDVVAKREKIWQEAQAKNNQIYQRWHREMQKHFNKDFNKSLRKMKKKQKQVLTKAKEEQSQIPLVDYTFNKISNLDIINMLPVKKGWHRGFWLWSKKRDEGVKYTEYLAARSIKYANGENWQED